MCDDGLRVMGEAEREARMAFYANQRIGWVARPADGDPGETTTPGETSAVERGFVRAGRFKKASNLNYGLALSVKMERCLREVRAREASGDEEKPQEEGDEPTVGESLEDEALRMACDEVYEESGRRWRPWASNGKSIRVGEIILLVDSDTVVPEVILRIRVILIANCNISCRIVSEMRRESWQSVRKWRSFNTNQVCFSHGRRRTIHLTMSPNRRDAGRAPLLRERHSPLYTTDQQMHFDGVRQRGRGALRGT